MVSKTVRNFGKVRNAVKIEDLVAIQHENYENFLQKDVPPKKRKNIGIEALFQEIFPIESYDGNMTVEYLCYELEPPRYSELQCRQLKLSYAYPLKVHCRLQRKEGDDLAEQAIYIGEMPVMIGGGEFIINGAERIIVNQLHRSPGVDFVVDSKEGDRVLHGGRIIPERGSWIEISVTKKDVLVVRIDQSSKIPATLFLRALDPECSDNSAILRKFYPTKVVPVKELKPDMWTVAPVVDTETGEILAKPGTQLGDKLTLIKQSSIGGEKAKYIDKENKWTDEGRKWIEDNQQRIRESLYVNSGKHTGGLAFKYLTTEKKGKSLGKKELEALEAAICRQYSYKSSQKYPKFNKKSGLMKKSEVNKIWNSNRDILDELFNKCKTLIEDTTNWIDVKNLDEDTNVPNTQGIYFFKDRKTGKVNDGYIGLAGSGKLKNPDGQGLQERLEKHFRGKLSGDNLLKTFARLVVDDLDSGSSGSLKELEVIEKVQDMLILNTVSEDDSESHEDAILKFYMRLRPGSPPNEEKANGFFEEKFFDTDRYRLGKVGRFRLNRKFGQDVPESELTLRAEDFGNTINYILNLRSNKGEVDDIDHLGNRRVRTIDELAGDEIRKGLLKLRKTVQERMSSKRDADKKLRLADLVNSKSVASSVNYFFGRGELSQIVDQTNALSQLTHERRLSALGPGGLNRKRAGFEVRDVHISHYGRICPIETPEGTNIGLISSLAVFSKVDEYGFLLTPYIKVNKGKVGNDVAYLRADEDMRSVIAAPATVDQKAKKIKEDTVLAMKSGVLAQVSKNEVEYVDVSPMQTVGLSASLIPFLEHDDANRALMGSNMQRQAVPLLNTERPVVGTGMEEVVGSSSSMTVKAPKSGEITAVDATHIVIDDTEEINLKKFVGLNERTCLNQKPIVKPGDKVKKGQVIADGGATDNGYLALGKNILAGFVSFEGYNFEDAIVVSERLVKDDIFTSIHIDEFTAEVRETRLGKEEFTSDIPNVSEKALRNLNEDGVVREGTRIWPGDILVGKVVPKSKTELTPEEKLLHAIFGRAGEDVKNDSLEVPSGCEGVVIKTERFSRRGTGSKEDKKKLKEEIEEVRKSYTAKQCRLFREMIDEIHDEYDVTIVDPSSLQKVGASDNDNVIAEQVENFDVSWVKPASLRGDVEEIVEKCWGRIEELSKECDREITNIKRGDELPSGVLEMVKIYVATKRELSVGDKIAGRHGNKGVIAKIMPEEDMPFTDDGRPLDILLNPLGVPSRMNVGQILETHLGWVAKVLGFDAVTPVFDGASEKQISELIDEANQTMEKRKSQQEKSEQAPQAAELSVNIPKDMKAQLYDGRTGEPFDQRSTIGFMYILKLHHLVDDKIHARATGPYSLITQQPLGGKARTGGQRFGEMEVWALEGYGAAYTLQEMLTVKSDDVEGRTKIYESMVKGNNTLEAGTPLSFDVLCNEIRGLGLNIQLEKKKLGNSGL